MRWRREKLEEEAKAYLEAHPETIHIDAFIIDLCGRAVGKRYPVDDLAKLFSSGSQLCAATYLLDACGNSVDPLGHGFSDGDPDADSYPVPGTLAPVTWAGGGRGQCMLRLINAGTCEPVWFEPRVVLEKVVRRFEELRLRPVVAVEVEFYLTDAERDERGAPQLPRSPRTGQRVSSGKVFGLDVLDEFAAPLRAIETAAEAQSLPITTALSEYGAGQFEINLHHRDDPIGAADDAALLRRCVEECARATGFDATFMSKPFAEQSGSGLQINMSVLDERGGNIFDPSSQDGETNLRHAIAGLQATLAEAFAIFAPSVNASRRFEPNQFTPVTRDWGLNNRSMAFRIPASDAANRRIEHRAAGAEANPYLVMAAVLAGAHYGLKNQLEPTEIATGNAGADADQSLPFTIWSALDAMAAAKILPDYLGEDYIEAYVAVKRGEFDTFMGEILPREYDWYL